MAHAARVYQMAEAKPPADERPPQTKEEAFLRTVRDAGNWTRISMPALRLLIDTWYAQRIEGEEVPEMIAELDLIYGADRRDVRPVRYYMKRWGWKRTRTYDYLKARGLNRERTTTGQQPDNHRTKQPPNVIESTPERTTTGQQPDNHRTVSPDSDSDFIPDNNNSGIAREQIEVEEPEGEEYFDPHYRRPSREEVVGRGKMLGLDEGLCTRFLKKYTANGWLNGSDQPIANWVAQLELWVDKAKADASNPPPAGANVGRQRGGMVAVRQPITHAAYCELTEFHRRDLAECYDDAGRVHWYRRGDGLPEPYTTTKPTPTGAKA